MQSVQPPKTSDRGDRVIRENIRVLMIEDNPADVLVLKRAIREITPGGFNLEEATTLAEGLRRIKAGGLDVVLLDLGLPDSKGPETIQKVTANAPDVPIVVLTISNDEALALEAVRQGVQAFIVKGEADARLLGRAIRFSIERKAAQRALRETEERYRAFVANSSEGIMRIEADPPISTSLSEDQQVDLIFQARIAECNDAKARMFGYAKAQDVIGKKIEDFMPRWEPRSSKSFRDFIRSGYRVTDRESKEVDRTGRIRYFSNSVVGVIENGILVRAWGSQRDITDMKETAARLTQAAGELERSNKDLELFAYAASHDLQEPLRVVTLFLQLLKDQYAGQLDKKAQEYIAHAFDGANRMSAVIKDLLTYSRVGSQGINLAALELQGVVEYVKANLRAAIEESNAVITSDPMPTVTADGSQMQLLLQNLISNALKFRHEDRPPEVHIGASRQQDHWLFQVKDNGIGIEPRQMDRVFLLFQRLHSHEKYPGTGIGLAICKKIVERHGGRICAESEPGKGSTFLFTIPILSAASRP